MLNFVDASQVQQLLSALPASLVLVDDTDTVCWVNDSVLQWTASKEDEWIGQARASLPAPRQALVTQGNGRVGDATPRHVACVTVDMGEHQLYYCTDVSAVARLSEERDHLRHKVEELDPRDAVTGLLNRRALFQNLEQQASRSRRYGNILSVMILQLSNLADYREAFGDEHGDQLLLGVTHMLNDQMRWADVIGRVDDNEFLIVMPETDDSVARGIREKINECLKRLELPGAAGSDFRLALSFGVAQWRKGDDVGLLMQRVRDSLSGDRSEQLAV